MPKYLLIFLLSSFHILATAAWAQETGQVVFQLKGEIITTSGGKIMTWQRYKFGTKAIDLITAVGKPGKRRFASP